MPPEPVVSVRNLQVTFVGRDRTVHAVNGASFDLAAGEVLGILGESGSGKSVTLRALMGLLPAGQTRIEGEASVTGRDIGWLSGKALADFRGRTIAMIFQEPMTALDPVYTIGGQIEETIVRHEGVSRGAATVPRAARSGANPIAAPRCRHADERCRALAPAEHLVAVDHMTRCVRVADGSLWESVPA